ncbi:hypothetical protein T11_16956 [Trichinella zimbabwensis]|uniref:Uncharacterized protein n=1 Tax=Trichinella zimbabwensis TaxID=268475 RepID=A0A0V1GJW8_9BILA|nr:hypothetical protein T11_16956 [Trichinella zimbabwensis]
MFAVLVEQIFKVLKISSQQQQQQQQPTVLDDLL